MSKEILKGLIDMLDENDIDTIYKILIKFIPEDIPADDEIEAIKQGKDEITNGNFEDLDSIEW